MKKTMLALAMFLTVVTTTVFAREENVSKQVLNSFQTEFATAQDVTWSTGSNYYKASFTLNGQKVFAFYAFEGELLGLARYISSIQLPLQLLTDLKSNYSGYWITDVFEVNNESGTQYYITLENAGTVLKLRSADSDEWNTLEKKRKI